MRVTIRPIGHMTGGQLEPGPNYREQGLMVGSLPPVPSAGWTKEERKVRRFFFTITTDGLPHFRNARQMYDQEDWHELRVIIRFHQLPKWVQLAFKAGIITELELDTDRRPSRKMMHVAKCDTQTKSETAAKTRS